MLESLACHDPVSPTSFSLSVHNAIAGLFSITRSDQANNVVISARQHLVENALTEACGILHDGAKQVLIIVYNNVLPTVYENFSDREEHVFAWAWLIEKPNKEKGIISLSLSANEEKELPQKTSLPDELDILRFFVMQEKRIIFTSSRQRWVWSRDAE